MCVELMILFSSDRDDIQQEDFEEGAEEAAEAKERQEDAEKENRTVPVEIKARRRINEGQTYKKIRLFGCYYTPMKRKSYKMSQVHYLNMSKM